MENNQERVLAFNLATCLNKEDLKQIAGGTGAPVTPTGSFHFTGAMGLDVVYDF